MVLWRLLQSVGRIVYGTGLVAGGGGGVFRFDGPGANWPIWVVHWIAIVAAKKVQ